MAGFHGRSSGKTSVPQFSPMSIAFYALFEAVAVA